MSDGVSQGKDLSRLRQMYQLILGAADEGIYGLDREGRTTFVNDAAIEILGWKEEELIGVLLHDIHHHSHEDGSHYPREECPIFATLRDGKVHRASNEVFWRSCGTSLPVEYTSTPIWEDGELQGALVVFRDVSEQREADRAREAAYLEIKGLKEQLELERDYLRQEINFNANFGEIIGDSQALKRTLSQIEAVAATNTSVLILGESGVGKEMIARAIHNHSERSNAPMVKVNCASIPQDLFESEFFGHVRGSFTGAHRDRVGRLELANGGTLFLDEVGEIPLDLQGKLLRALQEQEFERIGDEKTLSVDVRIVAATNRDLATEVRQGRFREDLYYRLSVFPIDVPPLRDRVADIIPLAQHFLNHFIQEQGREPLHMTRQGAELLKGHAWPGNIRELKNVVERALILSGNSVLRLDLALPNATLENESAESAIEGPDFLTDSEFRRLEKANIIKALRSAGWKISGEQGAAKLLGIKPSTLAYRMSVFNIKKP